MTYIAYMPLLKRTANLKTVVLINGNIGVAKVGNLAYKLKKRKTLKPLHSGSETSALTTRKKLQILLDIKCQCASGFR